MLVHESVEGLERKNQVCKTADARSEARYVEMLDRGIVEARERRNVGAQKRRSVGVRLCVSAKERYHRVFAVLQRKRADL